MRNDTSDFCLMSSLATAWRWNGGEGGQRGGHGDNDKHLDTNTDSFGNYFADGIWLICWGMNVGCERRGIKLNSAALSLIDEGVFAEM